jgi:hypothetical protein
MGLCCIVFGSAAAQAPSPVTLHGNPNDIVAQRGAVSITVDDVRGMLAAADPDQRKALIADPSVLRDAVRNLLLGEVVLQQAHAHLWDARPDVVYRAERAREASITQSFIASFTQPDPSYPSEAELEQTYEENKAQFMLPRRYHLAQIFVAVPANVTPAADSAVWARLSDFRRQVIQKKADFASLAQEASDVKLSGAADGDLGWLREDQIIPTLLPLVAALGEGGISDPIRLADGWHLIRLLGIRPAGPATLMEIHDSLARAMRQVKQQQNASNYLKALEASEPIELNEIVLSNAVN